MSIWITDLCCSECRLRHDEMDDSYDPDCDCWCHGDDDDFECRECDGGEGE